MKIKPFTPAIRMQQTAIINRSMEWWDDVAAEYGVTKNEVFAALRDLATMSMRINGQGKMLDFELPSPSDDSATLRKKFVAYLNTSKPEAVWEIERALQAFDRPVDPDTAPEKPSDPEA
jgi:hypothetical protein